MPLEKQSDFARRLGVNRSTVTRHAQAGRIVLVDGLVDVDASLARLQQTTGTRPDVAARHAADKGSDRGQGPATGESPSATPDSTHAGRKRSADGVGRDKADHKADALKYENLLIHLEMDLRAGRRLPLDAVRREAASIGGMLRGAFERVSDQTAPRLAVMTSTDDRAALLRGERRSLRRILRSEFPRALRRIRKQGKGT